MLLTGCHDGHEDGFGTSEGISLMRTGSCFDNSKGNSGAEERVLGCVSLRWPMLWKLSLTLGSLLIVLSATLLADWLLGRIVPVARALVFDPNTGGRYRAAPLVQPRFNHRALRRAVWYGLELEDFSLQ